MTDIPFNYEGLLANLHGVGLSVVLGDKPGELKLVGPAAGRSAALMAALRQFKPELLRELQRPTPEPVPEIEVGDVLYVLDSTDPAAIGGKWVGQVFHPKTVSPS